MTRILVAGCGYVGARLAEQQSADGAEVFGLRRQPKGLHPAITPIVADLLDVDSLRRIPDQLDAVVYAAAADGRSDDAYHAIYDIGVGNLLTVLAERAAPPKRFVLVSSVGVYGERDGELVDETTPPTATGPSRHIIAGERRLADAPIRGVIARLAGIYGPGRTRLIDQVRRGDARYHCDPPLHTNRIHRDDAALAIAHVLTLDDPAPVYVVSDDRPSTDEEVLRFLAAELGAPEPSPADGQGPRGAGKRCSNALLKASGYRLRFPTFRDGYRAMLRDG